MVAHAQPVAATEPKPVDRASDIERPAPGAPAKEPTAADVAANPLPGYESGRTDVPEGDSGLRRFGRAALFLPRLAAQVALAPIHGAIWAQDRYHLDDLYYRTFFNADRTIGLYPTVVYASGLGVSAGARFVDRDLFGEREAIALQATTGKISGESYHEGLLASIHTGSRLGRLRLGAEGTFDRRPMDPFYGIGNADIGESPSGGIDPREGDAAMATRYRFQEARTSMFADLRFAGAWHLRLTGAVAAQAFARSTTGPAIDSVYDTSGLVGWTGFSSADGDLELRIDERRRASRWEPPDLHGQGWLAAASLGRVHRLDDGPDFWRGSVELQEFFHIAKGPRMLALRARGEAVSGSLEEVPFTRLPMLGGGDFLRGYDFERFRDRISALASAEYVWDLAHWFDAAIFVDAGRVFPSFDRLNLDRVRVGYGAALEVFNDHAFLFEASIASSIDGGVFLNLSFNPVFDARPRWR